MYILIRISDILFIYSISNITQMVIFNYHIRYLIYLINYHQVSYLYKISYMRNKVSYLLDKLVYIKYKISLWVVNSKAACHIHHNILFSTYLQTEWVSTWIGTVQMVVLFVFFLSLKIWTITANHSVSFFFCIFKFLFHYISTTCVGIWDCRVWADRVGRLRGTERPYFLEQIPLTISEDPCLHRHFLSFLCNSPLLHRLPKGRGIAGIFLPTKPAYICSALRGNFLV